MAQASEKFLTLKQLQEITGLSDSTLRRRIKDGSLPAIQMGGQRTKLLFAPKVLEQLVTGAATPVQVIPSEPCELDGVESTSSHDHDTPQKATKVGSAMPRAGRQLSGPRPNWMRD